MTTKPFHKRWYMIVLYCFIGLMVFGSFLPDEQKVEKEVKEKVNKLTTEQIMSMSGNYEVNELWQKMGASPICFEYIIDSNRLMLKCSNDLSKAGMIEVGKRMENYIQSINESASFNIVFKDWNYKTLEIVKVSV